MLNALLFGPSNIDKTKKDIIIGSAAAAAAAAVADDSREGRSDF